MTTTLSQAAKGASDKIIALSVLLQHRMVSWEDVFTRVPDSQNVGVTAGFITDWRVPNAMELLVEVQAPADATSALVRTQIIETMQDETTGERFDQVALHYTVEYDRARQLVENGGATSREDIASLLLDDKSQLSRILMSDKTGKDEATGELLGTRYDLDASALAALSEADAAQLQAALQKILTVLEASAAREAKAQ